MQMIPYREEKAAQAAAHLIAREGGRMNHMKLIKLLYLVERQAVIRWGRPITFDWYYSLPHGPVLSFTLDRINQEAPREGASYWHRVISERSDHSVGLRTPEDTLPTDQLSDAELELLDEVYQTFGSKDQYQLRDYTHTLPEWEDPKGSSRRIQIRDILYAEGFSEDDVARIEGDLQDEAEATDLLGC